MVSQRQQRQQRQQQRQQENIMIDQGLLAQYGFGGARRKEIPVLISTDKRAFAGWIDPHLCNGTTVHHVRNLRNARKWGVDLGTAELASRGPGVSTQHPVALDEPSDAIIVTEVRVIRPLTGEAIERWGI
jgi:hypothetical protein